MAWVAGSNFLDMYRLYDITAKRGTSGEILYEKPNSLFAKIAEACQMLNPKTQLSTVLR